MEGGTPHRLTFFNSYTISEGSLQGLCFGGGIVYAKCPIQQFGTPVNALVAEDGYTTIDLFARYPTEIGGRQVTFGVNIENVNDAFSLDRGVLSAIPERFCFPSQPICRSTRVFQLVEFSANKPSSVFAGETFLW